ncbi:hypothetical protein N9Y89_01775 [bacterium]|nr:hypothetical protein [bacterium]
MLLRCYDNQLNNLFLGTNLINGNLQTYNNPYLNCINVNNLNYYNINTYSNIDPWQYFSDDCFGSSWDCVEGACVEQIGAIGTYQEQGGFTKRTNKRFHYVSLGMPWHRIIG